MKLNVYAHPCEFERAPTHTTIKFQMFGVQRLHSTIEEFRNVEEVEKRLADIAEMCAAKYPDQSFFVSEVRLRDSGRAFANYKRIRTLEYDHKQAEGARVKWRSNRA